MSIYTKKGDKGETKLYSDIFGKKKRWKNSLRIHAIGTIDELNSFLGVILSEVEDKKVISDFKVIQNDLLKIGSILGGSSLRLTKKNYLQLERQIDEIEEKLPKLEKFVLPGGRRLSAKIHFARALARRVERNVVSLHRQEPVKPQILIYLNRLSDYLFVYARKLNFKIGIKDEIWVHGKK